jgi:branched-chain amino acid transport system permease protein
MKELFMKKPLKSVFVAVLFAVLVTLPAFVDEESYILILISNVLMYVVLTLSWSIFSGLTGYISLASASFFGIGAYTSAILSGSLPLPVLMVIGGVASFILAFLVGSLTLRLKGMYFTMFTFGLVELVRNAVHWWEVNVTGTVGRLIASADTITIFYAMVVVFLATVSLSFFLRRSKYGLALQGIGASEEATAHAGVNVNRVKALTFATSAFFMGLAGVTMSMRWTYIDPVTAFNVQYSFTPMLMAIFGGMGQLYGPVIGATIFSLLEEFLTTKFPYYYMLLFGLTMIAVIKFMPGGVESLAGRWFKSLTKEGRGAP